MTTTKAFGRSLVALGITAALSTTRVLAQDASPNPQKPDDSGEELNEIVVTAITGSRTISDYTKSPTPITSVDVSALAVTTPSDTADALNKLPSIMGGRTPRTQGNGSTNNGGNTLSLRNFGAARTLVLLDGHRIAPNNQDGSVNIDVLPQMLVQNVDIVTGGASAIYGSDAVAGVVNYVLNKKFTGLTVKGDLGRSNYNDGDEYQAGIAWGTALFSDRGHFEASARFRHQDMIPMKDRPYGEDGQAWLLTGNGSLTNPFTNTPYGRVVNQSSFGTVNCGASCAYNGYTFHQAGVLTPLVHGTPTRVPGNIESGGDGGWVPFGTFRSEIEMKDVFARFSLDLGEKTNWYVQGSWAEAENASDWINWVASASGGRPNTMFANNPFLSTVTQQQLGSNIVCGTPGAAGWRCLPASPPTSQQTQSTPPAPPTTPIFSAPSYIWNNVEGEPANGHPNRMYRTLGDQKSWSAETGITGEVGGLDWDVYFNHGVSELEVTNPNNTDNAKYLAALDAVNVGGTIQCYVSTIPQYAALYPGCVPVNITDPAGPSAAAYDYLRTKTSWLLTQKMDNVGASIGGGLWGFGLPAGEITANVSVDARWSTYTMESDFLPTDYVNCTGLRMCLANPPNPARPDLGAPLRWVQNTNAPVDAKNHVYEGALEFNVPLVKDVPGFEELTANVAGRYTKYSSFDKVESWKLGLNWKALDFLRFRGTLSSDIRAPNLNDLFQPTGVTSTGFRDLLTGKSDNTRLVSRGNPNLSPEEAKTLTVGMVITPTDLPNFSASLDYYQTRLTNAIINVSYQADSTQNICLSSAPRYDAPFCALVNRPITDPNDPNFRNGALNYPTEVIATPFNAALQKVKGYDFQLDYNVDLWGGQFAFRHLATYQPVNSTLNEGAKFYTWAVAPKYMQTTFVTYRNHGFTGSLQNRWLSSVSLKTSANRLNGNSQNYVDSSLDAYDVVDATISKEFEAAGGNLEAFLTVNNLTNERAPLFPSNSGLPGLFYPTLGFYDDMGRYYTAGFRMKF